MQGREELNGEDNPERVTLFERSEESNPSREPSLTSVLKPLGCWFASKKPKKPFINKFIAVALITLVFTNIYLSDRVTKKEESTQEEDGKKRNTLRIYRLSSTSGHFKFLDNPYSFFIEDHDIKFHAENGILRISSKHGIYSPVTGEVRDEQILVEGEIYLISFHSKLFEIVIIDINQNDGVISFTSEQRN